MCTTLWHSHLRCLSRIYYEILRPVGCMKASIEQYGCSLDALMHPTGWETPPEEKATYHANYAANMDKIAKLKKAGVWDAWSETTNRRKDSDETAANMVTSTSMTGTDGKVAVTLDAPAKTGQRHRASASMPSVNYPWHQAIDISFRCRGAFWRAAEGADSMVWLCCKEVHGWHEEPIPLWRRLLWPLDWESLDFSRFLGGWENRSSIARLSDFFGPFSPIFMTYADLWVANAFEYESMIEALRKTVRPNVAYITVVQHDTGLVSSREKIVKIMKEIPNALVLSAGGYGHVPIPLFKQPEDLLERRFFKSMEQRELLTS